MSQELTLFGPELERAFQEHPASVAKAKRERPLRAVEQDEEEDES